MPQIDLRQIDAIVAYLALFERQGFKFGEWTSQEGQMPYYSYSPKVLSFIDACYQGNLVIPFDWTNWQEARIYVADPRALESADMLTLCKLLTAHLRADRFTEGHLAEVLESGHITAILRRLEQIRSEMRNPARL